MSASIGLCSKGTERACKYRDVVRCSVCRRDFRGQQSWWRRGMATSCLVTLTGEVEAFHGRRARDDFRKRQTSEPAPARPRRGLLTHLPHTDYEMTTPPTSSATFDTAHTPIQLRRQPPRVKQRHKKTATKKRSLPQIKKVCRTQEQAAAAS